MPVTIAQTFGPNAVDWENRIDMRQAPRASGWPGCARSWSGPSSARC